jgi:DNA-binding IclR family transcriptional regulator
MWGGLYQQLDLRRVVEPFLRELAEETGDVALLLVLNDKAAVCIDRYQGNYMLQFATPIGVSIPLHMGASPKLLLAYLPEPEREQLIDEMELTAMTPYTITDRQELRRRLQQIRTQGYSIDEQDYELGVYAIGAPVRDHTGRVVAGITVATPDVRWDEARKQALIRLVVETAGKISGRLRYSENPSNGVLASF